MAHPQREVKHPFHTILAHDLPTSHATVLYLVGLADELRRLLNAEYATEIAAAEQSFRDQEDYVPPLV